MRCVEDGLTLCGREGQGHYVQEGALPGNRGGTQSRS